MYLDKEDSPVEGKVLSIAYGYKDCFKMASVKNNGKASVDSTVYDNDILDKYDETDITIFRLIGDDSPFNK